MNTNRPLRELLTILRDNLDTYLAPDRYPLGMCGVISILKSLNTISRIEAYVLDEYLRLHRPNTAVRRENEYLVSSVAYKALIAETVEYGMSIEVICLYWFPLKAIEPRKLWLNRQLRRTTLEKESIKLYKN